jgi:hypothetical protein
MNKIEVEKMENVLKINAPSNLKKNWDASFQ